MIYSYTQQTVVAAKSYNIKVPSQMSLIECLVFKAAEINMSHSLLNINVNINSFYKGGVLQIIWQWRPKWNMLSPSPIP